MDWQSYLTINLSSGLVNYNTRNYRYNELTDEVVLEVDYLENLEDLYLKERLAFTGGNSWRSRLLQGDLDGIQEFSQ
jgi:hypothetical protein